MSWLPNSSSQCCSHLFLHLPPHRVSLLGIYIESSPTTGRRRRRRRSGTGTVTGIVIITTTKVQCLEVEVVPNQMRGTERVSARRVVLVMSIE